MAEEDPKVLEHYKATLRRQEMHWRARLDIVLANDSAAVDIGLVALRTAILVNAGAVVALLAFVGQLWNALGDTKAIVLNAIIPFVVGLASAGLAAGVAYIYQSIQSALASEALAEISAEAGDLKSVGWFSKGRKWTAIAMVGLVAFSLFCFIGGAVWVIFALR
jgi:hypothetical protein